MNVRARRMRNEIVCVGKFPKDITLQGIKTIQPELKAVEFEP